MPGISGVLAHMVTHNQLTIEQLAELAMESERTDSIDWADLQINEPDAYRLMASHVIEMDNDVTILKAAITHLLVENFVLNTRLLRK